MDCIRNGVCCCLVPLNMGRIKWFAAWSISRIQQKKSASSSSLGFSLWVDESTSEVILGQFSKESSVRFEGFMWIRSFVCYFICSSLFILTKTTPSLPSVSVPNAVVEGRKCWWDAVWRVNAHLPFHNMPCDFCVDYVKKGGYFCFQDPPK